MEADRQFARISKRLVKAKPQRTAASRSGARSSQPRGGRSAKSSSRASTRGSHGAMLLTDHNQIQRWAEERGGKPACVRGTAGFGDTGMIRIDFPGYSGEQSLQPISWDDWFEKFDERGLGLLVQETMSGGQRSNFNKLINRGSAERPKARAAR
jgi:hypothetical protein